MSVDKIVALAIAGGARIIQYRNKQSPKAIRLYEAEQLAKLCKKLDTTLLINDDIDIAIEVNADGVHLGQEDTGLAEARARLGPDKIIGITCHNDIELARRAQAGGADCVAFGRFFPSLSKPSAPAASLETLQQAHQELDIPICAIGGITLDNAPELIKSGADPVDFGITLHLRADEAGQPLVDLGLLRMAAVILDLLGASRNERLAGEDGVPFIESVYIAFGCICRTLKGHS